MASAGPKSTETGDGRQRQRWRQVRHYALAVAAVAATFALRLALAPACGSRVMLNLFSLPVLLCAYFGGVGPGLLATALVTLSVICFLPSGFNFGSLTTADAIMMAMFVVTNLVIIVLVEGLHRTRRRLEQTLTERTRVEGALDEERQLLRTLINSLPDLIFTKDMAARFIISNTAHLTFMGVPDEAALAGKTVLDLHPEELARGYYEDDLRVMRTGQAVINREELVQDHDGVRRWFLTIKMPLRDHTGKITGLVAVCRDITERRKADQALRENERLLREVMDLVPHHIFAKDREGRYLFVNRAASICYGKEPQELVGHLELEFAPNKEQTAAFLKDDLEVIASGKTKFIPEEPGTFSDGSVHWLQTTKTAFVPPGATERAVMGVAVDITERKRAELALAESEEKFRRIAANIDDVLYSVDTGTREFAYVSPAFEQLLGYALADVQRMGGRRAFLAQVIQDGKFAELERLMDSLQSPHPVSLTHRWETWWRCKDGSLKCIEDHWIAVYDGDRLVATEGVLRNVTERKRLEAQVQQAQKMEAVGQLAGGVAHDFNNILQSILGFTDILLADTPPATQHHGDLLEIRKSAERAAGLTRQLLAFSRRQMIMPTVLDLNSLVSNMHKMLHRLIGEDIQLVTELAADLPRVKADAGQIEQVILNLVLNARDAMPQGGRMTLTTASVALTTEDVHFLSEGRMGQFVRLTLSDTGTGIAPDLLPHIFEPFFSTKGPGQGTGLGLSVIYGIAQQHNGWVNVYSQLGHGTAFKLYLPAYAGAEDLAAAAAHTPPAPPRGHSERILLIEDEPEVRSLATRVLLAAGYDVRAAGTAAEGRALFARENGRFDLVFSDVVLPDQNGITTVEQFLQTNPDLAVLLCSGYTDERSRWHTIAEKKFPFLQKPYPAAELLHIIHAILDARPVAQP
jgi:PAS domain S-box-containing protein